MARKPEQKQQKQYCNKSNKDFKTGPHFLKKHPKNRIILTVVETVRGHDKKVRQWGETKEKSRRENSVGDAQNLLEATKNFSSLYI